jgi:hypothetical protein
MKLRGKHNAISVQVESSAPTTGNAMKANQTEAQPPTFLSQYLKRCRVRWEKQDENNTTAAHLA